MNLNGKLKIQINIFYKYIIIYIYIICKWYGNYRIYIQKNIDFYIFYKMKYNIYIYYIIYKIIRKKWYGISAIVWVPKRCKICRVN